MMCDGCTRGDHCGTTWCTCQHRRRPQTAVCGSTAPGVTQPPTDASTGPADPPSEAAEAPFTSVLADWMRHHRAGRFDEAAALRRALIARLNRAVGEE